MRPGNYLYITSFLEDGDREQMEGFTDETEAQEWFEELLKSEYAEEVELYEVKRIK